MAGWSSIACWWAIRWSWRACWMRRRASSSMACFSTKRASSMSADQAVSRRSGAYNQRMDDRYFVELAAAFVRGKLSERPDGERDESEPLEGEPAIARGLEAGLRL